MFGLGYTTPDYDHHLDEVVTPVDEILKQLKPGEHVDFSTREKLSKLALGEKEMVVIKYVGRILAGVARTTNLLEIKQLIEDAHRIIVSETNLRLPLLKKQNPEDEGGSAKIEMDSIGFKVQETVRLIGKELLAMKYSLRTADLEKYIADGYNQGVYGVVKN